MFKHFDFIPFVKSCGVSSTDEKESQNLNIKLFPNPCVSYAEVEFQSSGKFTELSIFDVRGAKLNTYISKKLQKGEQKFTIDMSDKVPGVYFVYLKDGVNIKSIKLIRR
jgi:hypothetical protein